MSDTPTPIPPALTAEEWRRELAQRGNGVDVGLGLLWAELSSSPEHKTGEVEANREPAPWLRMTWKSVDGEETIGRRHALAALALHGQPFGFTRDDLWVIDEAIGDVFAAGQEFNHNAEMDATSRRVSDGLESLRARIAALLPPETP